MSLKTLTKTTTLKVSLFLSFNIELSWLGYSFEFFWHKLILCFKFLFLLQFCSIFSLHFCRLETSKFFLSFFCVSSFGYCHCFISSSCDIDSALSVSVSCNTSVAILKLFEAVFHYPCFSTFCLQQGRGPPTLVFLFLQTLLWRHNATFLSRSSFNISSLSLPSQSIVFDVLFTAVVRLCVRL